MPYELIRLHLIECFLRCEQKTHSVFNNNQNSFNFNKPRPFVFFHNIPTKFTINAICDEFGKQTSER